jgi:hypothetical protein
MHMIMPSHRIAEHGTAVSGAAALVTCTVEVCKEDEHVEHHKQLHTEADSP